MITLPANTRIWIAAGVTDLRRGFTGLSALVQTKLEQSPSRADYFRTRDEHEIVVSSVGVNQLGITKDGECIFGKVIP